MSVVSLGEQIRVAREAKKWSPEQLAVLLQVSKQSVLNYESDKAVPRKPKLERLEILLERKLNVTGSSIQGVGIAQEHINMALAISRLTKSQRDALAILIKGCSAQRGK